MRIPIMSYEGKYDIDENGNVYSLNYQGTIGKEKILKWKYDTKGYARISLHKYGKCEPYKIHRLVAYHFHYNDLPNINTQVHHKDQCKLNNHISNLEWVSNIENCQGQNQGMLSNNTSGHKNIHKFDNGYRFAIAIYKKRYSKWVKTLDEAVAYKEKFLSTLPTKTDHDEI